MKRIQRLEKLEAPPNPYDCFDVIAGTGTGAVQACMLGRLRMPVESAIESYANLAKGVFSEKKRYGSGSFKTTKLKESLRNIIQHATGDPDEPMLERKFTDGQCTTLVFAMSKHNMRAGIPIIFPSCQVAANAGPDCSIWQILCATMAHPEFFKSFDIGDPPLARSFVDAGLGCNNPLAHLLAEVKTLHPQRYVASVTSIGTGHTRTIQIPNTSFLRHFLPIPAIVAMKAIATDTERVAEEMARRFRSMDGVYFRLNVDQGLQDVGMDGWEQLSEVMGHTSAYMKLVDVSQKIDRAAQSINSRKATVSTAQIDGEIQPARFSSNMPPTTRRCPAPSPIFTGCEPQISKVELCVADSTMVRKVCIVHGLGGAGKTQIALKVVERTYENWEEVIFIDASTQESVEKALRDVAVAKQVGDMYTAGLQWLECCHEPWLLILDNADDPSLPIRDYIPRGNHGSIIITTRLYGMVSLAQGVHSNCSVSSMGTDDALALLLKAAQTQGQTIISKEMNEALKLLQELGHFALAVVHAGSFIGQTPHMSITEYRSLLTRQRRGALEAYSKLPQAAKVDNYGHTVYTAWLMCYEQLSPRAQQLLWLVALMHHTGITIDIFRRAAEKINSHKPKFLTTALEASAIQQLQTFLCDFLDSNKSWDGLLFAATINEISSHSLLEYDAMNQTYRIHVLVQAWVHTVVAHDSDLAAECARTLLALSIPLDESLESIVFRINIGPHIDKVLLEACSAVGPNHAEPLFQVLRDRGQWTKSEVLNTGIQETVRKLLGNEHPVALQIMNNLALTYSELGRFDDARALHLRVLDARKQALGEDHPDTLSSMSNLALTYTALAQFEDSRMLHSQVLGVRKQVLGVEHPNTLKSMNSLANTYYGQGRFEDARAMYSQVLEVRKAVLGNDHPDTLSSIDNIALTQTELGRFANARALHSQVLDTRKRVLGNDHPDTLKSTNNLAFTYSKLGQFEDARALHSQVLNARKQMLGNDHPDTLKSVLYLSATHLKLDQFEEAEKLQINLDKYVRVFGENRKWTNYAQWQLEEIQKYRNKLADGSDW
ncbi:unnamed protein product [Rhizoctonia solani]|nr:unnamed protein product [Rhizoctonia solani]